ncbi:MAG: DUF488 domain-containing protein [Ilumatobacteraceae bacterium]
MLTLATIGYEGATVQGFLAALAEARIEMLVDVRAVAMSRRPGFAKTRLAGNLDEAGIAYLHLRGLGTPADGRAAARAGRHQEMHEIFREHMVTPVAQTDLATLVSIVNGGKRVALMCFETNPEHCHRSLVVEAMRDHVEMQVRHLFSVEEDPD